MGGSQIKESVALKFSGIEAGYHKQIILKDLSLTVKEGEFVAIIGDNGVGKTTLFRAILHLLPIQNGLFQVMERNIINKEDKEWVRSQIGYVPQRQEKGKFPISVFDAVLLGRWGKTFSYLRKPSKEDRDVVSEMLQIIGLEELQDKDCRSLSGGQIQRLNIARALVRDPKILLLDEPTTHLDTSAQKILLHLIRDIRKRSGLTVLMISHDHRHAEMLADRIVYLRDGHLYDFEETIL